MNTRKNNPRKKPSKVIVYIPALIFFGTLIACISSIYNNQVFHGIFFAIISFLLYFALDYFSDEYAYRLDSYNEHIVIGDPVAQANAALVAEELAQARAKSEKDMVHAFDFLYSGDTDESIISQEKEDMSQAFNFKYVNKK